MQTVLCNYIRRSVLVSIAIGTRIDADWADWRKLSACIRVNPRLSVFY